MTSPTRDEALTVALTNLLSGPVYAADDAGAWEAIRLTGAPLRDTLRALGLRLVVDDVDQYAYLRIVEDLPDGATRLIRRHQISHKASILLAHLRLRLTAAERDDTGTLIMTRDEMVDQMRMHHPDGTPEERIAADIAVLERSGFLRRLRGSTDTYEARPIIKALVTADWLAEYAETLGIDIDEDDRSALAGDDDDQP